MLSNDKMDKFKKVIALYGDNKKVFNVQAQGQSDIDRAKFSLLELETGQRKWETVGFML